VTSPGSGHQTGCFTYDALSGKWDWDDDVFRIHGYLPGSVKPTTQLVLDSKHPDDRARVAALSSRISTVGGPFSISYRLIGGDGKERRVVLVGQGVTDVPGEAFTIEGYYIDLTPDFTERTEEYAAAAVEASAESRAVIEQAKGALMMAYGLDDDQAFAMLRWWSRDRNVKVRDIAARLVEQARAGEVSDSVLRRGIDVLLHDITTDRS
jgi:hypothetical protein